MTPVTQPKNFTDDMLSGMADKNRPKEGGVYVDRPLPNLKAVCEPARRHRCEVCLEVFECHLCMIADDHDLHKKRLHGSQVTYICEACIHQHELWIVPVLVAEFRSHQGQFTTCFYDHLTGERLKSQHFKQRVDVEVTYQGITLNVSEWARRLGISRHALGQRLLVSDIERAFNRPYRPSRKRRST